MFFESIKESSVFNCVEEYIQCCTLVGQTINNMSKAKIQVYLAAQVPLVNSLGLAAQKCFWDFDKQCFSDIKKFLKELYS